jgi:bifunctional polynucleotide phosphatase/kinase
MASRRSKRKSEPKEEDTSSSQKQAETTVVPDEEEEETKQPQTKGRKGAKHASVKDQIAEVKDETEPLPPDWKWKGTMMYWSFGDVKPSAKIAGFDYDGTLAATSFGRPGPDAWKVLFPHCKEKLSKLHADGYKLVIFTNQGAIGKATKTKQKAIIEKTSRLMGFVKQMNLPFQVFVATANEGPKFKDDPYRKAATGMWHFMVEHCNGGVQPDLDASFYVGDAAGRRRDHNDTDKGFAEAIPIKFLTEDAFFKG